MILFGHPTGSPLSHHAALAHYEAGRLAAFCVPWMPTPREISMLRRLPGLGAYTRRLERRCFVPLLEAPRVEGRLQEWMRLVRRMVSGPAVGEELAYEANDWLMRTMTKESRRANVTAVHAYEDCSLSQFEEARRLGKACIYDMPIGYYPAWEQTQAELTRRYADWLPPVGLSSGRHVRPEQKQREMALADLVLAPSAFVRDTIVQFTAKPVVVAPYGVDTSAWIPSKESRAEGELRFLFAGQVSVRKGVPLLLDAWKAAGLTSARLDLVGAWQLADARRRDLPAGVSWTGPISSEELRRRYQSADVFVFPTFFEGRALVVSEALACGLPVLTTHASGTSDLVDDTSGRLVQAGHLDELVAALQWFGQHRDRLPALRAGARTRAMTSTWANYRRRVSDAVSGIWSRDSLASVQGNPIEVRP